MNTNEIEAKLASTLSDVAHAKTTLRFLYRHTMKTGDVAVLSIDVEERYAGPGETSFSCVVYSHINNIIFSVTDLPNASEAIDRIDLEKLESRLEDELKLGIEV